MAAPTVTLDTPRPGRIGNTSMGLVGGSVNVSSYDTTHPAVPAITGLFLSGGKLRVSPDGISSLGYLIRWDAASSSFKAYQPGSVTMTLAAPGAAAAITPPGNGVAYTNVDTLPQLVIITGQTSTHATVTRGGFTSGDIATSGPISVLLGVGDSLTVTYSAAGTWEKLPLAAYSAAVAAADVEVANATNVGTFDFLALGQLG